MDVQYVTWLPPLPKRPVEAHKGTFGSVLIAAGSRGMSGAACLAGLGALRGGAGLVTVAVPAGIQAIVAGVEPAYLTLALPEDGEGRIAGSARSTLEIALARNDVLGCGSGWGMSDSVLSLTEWIYKSVEKPVVLDADAINACGRLAGVFSSLPPAPRVLTPHPGEFARLLGCDTSAVQANREQLAVEFAARTGCVLVLKGAGTIITDGQRVAENTTGNSGMATGGTGDVLTGVIAALIAQGFAAFEAAQLGAHLHGLAGDIAAAELSQPGLIASDLPRHLGLAWKRLLT